MVGLIIFLSTGALPQVSLPKCVLATGSGPTAIAWTLLAYAAMLSIQERLHYESIAVVFVPLVLASWGRRQSRIICQLS